VLKCDQLIEKVLRWQQHALFIHTVNVRYGLKVMGLAEDSWKQPQEEAKASDYGIQMP